MTPCKDHKMTIQENSQQAQTEDFPYNYLCPICKTLHKEATYRLLPNLESGKMKLTTYFPLCKICKDLV